MTVRHRLFDHAWPAGEFQFFQLGFVVPDLLRAAAGWVADFGVGPFHLMPRAQSTCRYRGAVADIDLQIGVAQAGPVQIELICDHTDGHSVFTEMAARKGGNRFGFHQIATLTRDYDATIDHYLGRNHEIAAEMGHPGQRIAIIDTFAEFGFYTEVVEDKPSFRTHLAEIARTCRDWDGADPIRILTRDGYRLPDEPHPRKDAHR